MDIDTPQPNDSLKTLAVIGGWSIVLLVGIFAYWPGLDGPFVMDDFGSISAIGDRGGVVDWDSFKAFVFGGHAGPTGRPLALLSFLIDANNWPADAWPFKRTNLVIHLINGALLGILIGKILQVLRFSREDARWIALLSATCWLLHPFLVSTTLYAVQRMAQLSTLFIFAGLIVYLYGRSLLATQAIKAYLVMSVAIGLFTILAMISKENGILLPLLVAVIEYCVVSNRRSQLAGLNRYWVAVFLMVPSAVIAVYLGTKFFRDDFFDVVAPRDFSVYERLLTQPRILVDYLRHWFIPELYTTGIFQDHFAKSTGVFAPITTLPSTLLHVTVISVAILKRQKWPLFALAALFFYASHVLESSVINLELYFEHRNYLAAAFLFLPLIVALRRRANHSVFLIVAVGAVLMLGGFTRYSATIWQDYASIVEASAHKAPTSSRAQAQYSRLLFKQRRYEESIEVIDRAIKNNAGDVTLLLLNRLISLCHIGNLSADSFRQDAQELSRRAYDSRSIDLYIELTGSIVTGKCPGVSAEMLQNMFVDMLQTPQNADPQSLAYSQIKYFIGITNVHMGRPSSALEEFEESLRSRPGPGHAMMMAAHFASNDFFEEALYLSDVALSQVNAEQAGVMAVSDVDADDIRSFQNTVRADRDAAAERDKPLTE